MAVGRMTYAASIRSLGAPLLLAAMLVSCAKVPAVESAAAANPPSAKPAPPKPHGQTVRKQEQDMDAIDTLLPDDACTREGHWSFFESFVRWDAVRARHTADSVSVRSFAQPDREVGRTLGKDVGFRIALEDYRWVLAGSDQDLDLQPLQDGDVLRVQYTPVKLGPDDEVVRTLGAPGAYVFERRSGCWELTQELR